jgi:hypothetical protein
MRTWIRKQSLYDWCVENHREDILNRWDYELNNCLPIHIGYKASKKYYLKCENGIHPSELYHLLSLSDARHNNFLRCRKCHSFAQWGINNLGEDFLEKYWDYEKNVNIDP